MLAALILFVSIATLIQLFFSYTRALIASSRKLGLSEPVRELTGFISGAVQGDEFGRLLQLVQLCPDPRDDRMRIRAVRLYYGLLNMVQAVARSVAPRVASWAESERDGCAYFAALALDRRIAFTCELMAEQAANRL